MGWVPRGILEPELEKVAFSLEPGSHSQPISTPLGYYIIKVKGREVRPLSDEHRRRLGLKAWEQWLQEQRRSSDIKEGLTQRRLDWALAHAP